MTKIICTLLLIIGLANADSRNLRPEAELSPYYSLVLTNISDLKEALFLVTSFKHLAFEGDPDQLTTECSDKSVNCFGHKEFSYREVRKILFKSIELKYNNENQPYIRDIYCKQIIHENVGPEVVPLHTTLNAEHLWPQARFNPIFSKNLQKADLHHLMPVLTKANSRRGNYHFGEVSTPMSGCEESRIGKIGDETLFEPPIEFKGDIARALFYFSTRYKLTIEDREEAFLRSWHKLDPVSIDEIVRHEKVFLLQENRNPFIDYPHFVDSIENF